MVGVCDGVRRQGLLQVPRAQEGSNRQGDKEGDEGLIINFDGYSILISYWKCMCYCPMNQCPSVVGPSKMTYVYNGIRVK